MDISQPGWNDPLLSKCPNLKRKNWEFFLEGPYKPKALSFNDYSQIAHIFKQDPILNRIKTLFGCKIISVKDKS